MSLRKPKSAVVQVISFCSFLLFHLLLLLCVSCCLLHLRFLAEPLKNLSKLSVRRNNNKNYSATKWKETTVCVCVRGSKHSPRTHGVYALFASFTPRGCCRGHFRLCLWPPIRKWLCLSLARYPIRHPSRIPLRMVSLSLISHGSQGSSCAFYWPQVNYAERS